MSDLIDAVIRTRELSGKIAQEVLLDIENISEVELHERILKKMSEHEDIFPTGWYDPPPGGASVLFDESTFERLKYDSLRKPLYWPSKKSVFKKETVGSIYFSPVDRKTGMMGDIGFTLYTGENEEIREHLKNVYTSILAIANHVEVGMKVSDLCAFAKKLFQDKFRRTKWITISSDPNQSINLGHSVTGSLDTNFITGDTFEEIKETLKTKRVHLIDTENLEIPATCALIVESRLEDLNRPHLPSAYFQFIVCFDNGKKTILRDIDKIFKAVGMDYILDKS